MDKFRCYIFGIDDMLFAGLAAGGMSLFGGLNAQDKTDQRQQQAQAFNAQQAQAQMDFQERMSNTAYQRSMQDMEKAGLNPILAYQKGGASSPTGAMASTSYQPAQDVVTPAMNSAMSMLKSREEVKNMVETNDNIKMDTDLKRSQFRKAIAEGTKVDEETKQVKADTAIKVEQLPVHSAARVKSEIDRGVYESPAGRVARQAGTYGEEAQRASSAAGNFMNPVKTFNQLWKDRTDRGF